MVGTNGPNLRAIFVQNFAGDDIIKSWGVILFSPFLPLAISRQFLSRRYIRKNAKLSQAAAFEGN